MNVALTAPIDIDRIQQESDVRHEPPLIPPKLSDFHNASTAVQVHTPPDPADLPTPPPTSTPLPEQHPVQQQDVSMSEPTVPELPTFEPTPSEPTVEKVNGVIHHDTDINMDAPSSAEQPSLPPVTNGNHSSPNGYSSQPEEEGPPTKRARKHSDADQASTHVSLDLSLCAAAGVLMSLRISSSKSLPLLRQHPISLPPSQRTRFLTLPPLRPLANLLHRLLQQKAFPHPLPLLLLSP
jgi:hypothetical protein